MTEARCGDPDFIGDDQDHLSQHSQLLRRVTAMPKTRSAVLWPLRPGKSTAALKYQVLDEDDGYQD